MPSAVDEIGQLGPYRLIKVLGGGRTVVFRAEDTITGRIVALKMLRPALAQQVEARQSLLRGARSHAAINNAHVVPVYEVAERDGTPFLAMALLAGESLEARLKREKVLPVLETMRIGREIADGLATAHAGGIIHGALRPSKIFLQSQKSSRAPTVGILGFGFSARNGSDAGPDGTAYLAPEQPSGQSVDHRCDLFSVGCILYRLSTGVTPFQGEDAATILAAAAVKNPTPPHEINPDVPSALSDLILKLLAKKPGDRPALVEVARALGAPEDLHEKASGRYRALWIAAALLALTGCCWLMAKFMLGTS